MDCSYPRNEASRVPQEHAALAARGAFLHLPAHSAALATEGPRWATSFQARPLRAQALMQAPPAAPPAPSKSDKHSVTFQYLLAKVGLKAALTYHRDHGCPALDCSRSFVAPGFASPLYLWALLGEEEDERDVAAAAAIIKRGGGMTLAAALASGGARAWQNALAAAACSRSGKWLDHLLDEPALVPGWSIACAPPPYPPAPGRSNRQCPLHILLRLTHERASAPDDPHEAVAMRVLARTDDAALNVVLGDGETALTLAIWGEFFRVVAALLRRPRIELNPEEGGPDRTVSIARAVSQLGRSSAARVTRVIADAAREVHEDPFREFWCSLGHGHTPDLANLVISYARNGFPANGFPPPQWHARNGFPANGFPPPQWPQETLASANGDAPNELPFVSSERR
jgi:hypothetical protein